MRPEKIFVNAKFNIFPIIIFRFILDWGYVNFVARFFEYDGFILSVDTWKYFESYFLLVMIFLFVPKKMKKPSDFLLHVYLLLIILPLLSLYALANKDRFTLYLMISAYVLMVFLVRVFSSLRLNMVFVRKSNVFTMGLLTVLTLSFLVNVVLSGVISNFNLDFSRVYEYREFATVAIYSGMWGYLTNWVVKVANVALAAWFLYKRKWFFLFVVIILQVFYFGITTHKSTLFSIMLVPGIYFLFQQKLHPSNVMASCVIFFLTAVILVSDQLDSLMLGSMAIRRVFFVPANLSFVYVEFFSDNLPVMLSNSIFSAFLNYPYDVTTARLIGGYLGQPDMAANNGFIASGYMHFKIFGVLSFAAIGSFLMYLLNMISKKLPIWFCLSIVIAPFISMFTSSDLGTSILTHGLLFAMLILYGLSSRSSKLVFRRKVK